MKLVAFGESFTVGQNSEYKSHLNREEILDKEYFQFSYVNHIYDEMKDIFTEVHNAAGRGWNNDKIWFKIRGYFQKNNPLNTFAIIGWTAPIRYSFYYDIEAQDYERLSTNQRIIVTESIKTGILNYVSSVFNYETIILAAHFYLKSLGVKHMMIQSFHDHKEYFYDYSKGTHPIIPFNQDLIFWPNWCEKNNTLFDIARLEYCNIGAPKLGKSNHDEGEFTQYLHLDTLSSCLHPSPKGYKLIANTLIPYVKKILIDEYWYI